MVSSITIVPWLQVTCCYEIAIQLCYSVVIRLCLYESSRKFLLHNHHSLAANARSYSCHIYYPFVIASEASSEDYIFVTENSSCSYMECIAVKFAGRPDVLWVNLD